MLQTAAANALISAGKPAVPALLSCFESFADDSILSIVSYILSQNPSSPLSIFLENLSHRNPDVRKNCVTGIGILQAGNSRDLLLIENLSRVLYEDPDVLVSYEAALSLEKINLSADFWNALLKGQGLDNHVFNKIIEISGTAGDDATIRILTQMEFSDERLAKTAKESVQKLKNKK
ncbi:hypothetical protein MsAc7_10910 [Methanolapillus millepedarum]|uniref:HEAT repeat domain-containing protein n=2 Tax=Methanolapillus millepedarum TaxID=3028296 RepID=A0AA96V2W3_9EURY|nr:hypothetical protein MsAc7_10910 [Methanosarcinaceae archaeon Ac7]